MKLLLMILVLSSCSLNLIGYHGDFRAIQKEKDKAHKTFRSAIKKTRSGFSLKKTGKISLGEITDDSPRFLYKGKSYPFIRGQVRTSQRYLTTRGIFESSGKGMVWYLYPKLVLVDTKGKEIGLRKVSIKWIQNTERSFYEIRWEALGDISKAHVLFLADVENFDKRIGSHNQEEYNPLIFEHGTMDRNFGHFKAPVGKFEIFIEKE